MLRLYEEAGDVQTNSSYPIEIERMAHEVCQKLVSQICIKSDGDVFHQLFRQKPHKISGMCPDKVKACELHQGQWGTVGSVICWSYFHDGKERVAKEIIEAIDEENKSVTFNVIEGDLMEQFKVMKLIVHVDTKGEDNLVTWTLQYQKLNKDVADPHSLMDFCLHVTKDIETHHITPA